MKVDNPRFDSHNPEGTVRCNDCPFGDEGGLNERGTLLHRLCSEWDGCPTAETYAEACKLAEGAK